MDQDGQVPVRVAVELIGGEPCALTQEELAQHQQCLVVDIIVILGCSPKLRQHFVMYS